ncbi:hypothetical protein KCU61_g191, partial [Aureobasidium melanogenum]
MSINAENPGISWVLGSQTGSEVSLLARSGLQSGDSEQEYLGRRLGSFPTGRYYSIGMPNTKRRFVKRYAVFVRFAEL